MRNDADGMFWQDAQVTSERGVIIRAMPPIPENGWVTPTSFPRLDSAPVISFDTETYDPELLTRGPGWARGVGHIVGVSVAVSEKDAWYFPVRHEVRPETNMNPENVFAWLKDVLGTNTPKVGANLLYDIGWLAEEGVQVRGELYDVQFAEALLDERSDVDLETLGQKYLGLGKETSDLYQWCADFYGGAVTGAQRSNLWRAPPCLVGPYATADAYLPLLVLQKQWGALEREGLLNVFAMENGLIPLLIAMRQEGVSVDLVKAEETCRILKLRAEEGARRLRHEVGFEVNVNAADSIARAFDAQGIPYKKTAKGKASFTKEFLMGVGLPLTEAILEIRKTEKLRGTFLQSYVLDSHVNGKVYGQFHPLRGKEGGTRSGRLSSSTPNLQNLPSRDEILAPLIRGVFIPDAGHSRWVKIDYSQIEYRFMIHYASGPGAEEARQHFIQEPDTDYHEMTLDLVAPAAGWKVDTPELRKRHRKPIKNINFGLIYGMGVDKLSRSLGLSMKEGKALFAAYHKGVPFAKPTMDEAMAEASQSGVVQTILGRRSRFDLWEPLNWGEGSIALPYEKALVTYGGVRRAYTHKALNRRLQGSAADLMKMAMWKCWTGGVFAETGVPRLTVHDELDFSDPGGKEEAFAEMQHILETAIPLKIPVRADADVGPNWGDTTPIKKF